MTFIPCFLKKADAANAAQPLTQPVNQQTVQQRTQGMKLLHPLHQRGRDMKRPQLWHLTSFNAPHSAECAPVLGKGPSAAVDARDSAAVDASHSGSEEGVTMVNSSHSGAVTNTEAE